MNWAWGIPGLNPTERLTLLALADYADNDGYCFPGQDVLMERVGVSRRTIVSTLQALEDRGFFRRERRTLERGRRTSDGYQLGQRADSARATDDRPNVQTVAHTYKEEPSGEPSVPPSPQGGDPVLEGLEAPPAPAEDHFDLFWAAYPRKVEKPSARRAWAKAIKGGTHWSVIVGAAQMYADDPNREAQFTKYPGPWLRAEAWNDGPLPDRAPAQVEPGAFVPGNAPRTMSERVLDCADVGRQHRILPDGSCMLCELRATG